MNENAIDSENTSRPAPDTSKPKGRHAKRARRRSPRHRCPDPEKGQNRA